VVPLQAQLPAFDEPEYRGDALPERFGITGRVRLASYAQTKDSQAREEAGDRLPPYDPGQNA
jgi:hypothetical protein